MITPRPRSRARLFFGIMYFRAKRRINWAKSNHKMAKIRPFLLVHEYISHKTPLLRELKNIEMPMQYNKIHNLKIAAPKINKITIKPGEVFSYWRAIGKPTALKGYKKGMFLKNGQVLSKTGGGLCQLSNMLYWLVLHTPLTVVERYRHSYDVFPDSRRSQPFGSGATCFYNYVDLIIQNNTNVTFQITVEITEEHLEGAIFGDLAPVCSYEIYEKSHKIQHEYWGQYTRHNEIWRKKIAPTGEQIGDEFVCKNAAIMMYEPMLETQ